MKSTAERPLRLGIFGFGRLAQNYYVPALRRIRRPLAICVADPLDSSRAAAVKAFGSIPTYADYLETLHRESLGAVLVATPPSTHLAIWRETGAGGLPVFMEKPFLLTDELDQVDPTDPAWRNLMINFNRRFWPTYRRLAEWVADGTAGAVSHARFTLHVDAGRWSSVSNHRAQSREGGALYDLGSQMLDLVFVTFGRQPDEILARRSGSGGLDERVEVTLHFAGGLVVDCDLAYGRRTIESVSITGERGSLQLRNPNFMPWVERRPSVPGRLARSVADFATLGYRGLLRSRSMLRYSVHAALESFMCTLGSKQPFRPGFEDTLRVARWTRAAEHSIAAGRAVNLE
jgi:predicted dehydrogenase